MPEETREYFRKEPKLLSYLAHSAGKMLIRLARLSAAGKWSNYKNQRKIPEDAKPGIIIRIETAGGNLCWNPHFHCIETEGCYSPFDSEDDYYTGGFLPYRILRNSWMNTVLNLLENFRKITADQARQLRMKYKKGFNVNSQLRDYTGDEKLMYRQAQYIQKAPLSGIRIVNQNAFGTS